MTVRDGVIIAFIEYSSKASVAQLMVVSVIRKYANYSHPHARSFILLVALACAAVSHAAQTDTPFTQDVEARVVALTNELRKQQGLPAVQPEARLIDAGRYFAGYIAKTDKLDHDADGSSPPERAKKRGYNHCIIAENLAFEYDSAGFSPERLARNFVQGWSESATHRANMLEPEITQIGVGVAPGPKSGEYYAVQVLGRPLSQIVKFRVTNRTAATIRYEYRKRAVTLGPKQARAHESCVGGELKVDSAQPQSTAVRPKNGDRLAIVEAGPGAFRIREDDGRAN